MLSRYNLFILSIILTSAFYVGCQSKKNEDISLTALETAQQFLRLEMSGDYSNASDILLSTDYNQTILSIHQKEYDAISEEQKKELKSEIINIVSYNETSDSTAILDFSNALDTAKKRLYLIRKNKKWYVDFKTQNSSK